MKNNFSLKIGSCVYMFCYLLIVLIMCGRKIHKDIVDKDENVLLSKYTKLLQHTSQHKPHPKVNHKDIKIS